MKISLILFFIASSLCLKAQNTADTSYHQAILNYQNNLALEFSDPDSTPLDSAELDAFTGYTFLPINDKYRVEAKLKLTPRAKSFEMATSGKRRPIYRQYAIAIFKLDGKKYKLRLYRNLKLSENPKYQNHLFLPFNDLTNNHSTYGGGRFLDLEIPEGKTLEIDFNKAYNPYCAWSNRFSCTIPPPENTLKVEIPVGASFQGAHH